MRGPMPPNTTLKIPPGVPTYAALRDHLRTEILTGVIPADARLTTAFLVERYGFSQMPIREALQALEGEGLIEIQPHKGARVLPLDPRRVRNIYELRTVIESLLARLSLPNLTNAATAELAKLHAAMKVVAAKRDSAALFALNHQFHDLIYGHADNAEALAIYDRYASLLGSLRASFGFSAERMQRMIREHGEILDALRKQDPERLEAVVRTHCDGAKEDLLARIAREWGSAARTAAGGRR